MRADRSDSSPGFTITIATSIFPGRVEQQKEALASWHQLGFNVISVNTPGEIDSIKAEFPGVTFVTSERCVKKGPGKHYLYLDDLLKALLASETQICGIINSDIRFNVDGEFGCFIAEHAANGLVFGSRIDIESDDSIDGKEYSIGFDFFFIDKSIVPLIPPTEFCLGMPCWDYWLPLVALLQGVSVKQLITPVAYHMKHSANWDSQLLNEYEEKLASNIRSVSAKDTAEKLFNFHDDLYQGINWNNICSFMKNNGQDIFYPKPLLMKNLAVISEDRYIAMKNVILDYERQFEEHERQFEEHKRQLEAHERSFEAIFKSKSWVFTEPLRYVVRKYRDIFRNQNR